jgi:probable rRNA maturation factor
MSNATNIRGPKRAASVPPVFDLSVTAQTGRSHVPYLRRMIKRALPLIRNAPCEISVALVNDQRMSDLHQQFMNIAGPTDVLTFELDHTPRGRCVSGEVVVCVPEAKRRSRELKHRLEHELLLYAVHGILHLSGYDDRTSSAYRRMHREEDRILTAIGVGAVFAKIV